MMSPLAGKSHELRPVPFSDGDAVDFPGFGDTKSSCAVRSDTIAVSTGMLACWHGDDDAGLEPTVTRNDRYYVVPPSAVPGSTRLSANHWK